MARKIRYVYTLKSQLLEEVVEAYTNYATNKFSIYRRPWDESISMGLDIPAPPPVATPISIKERILEEDKVVWNLSRPQYAPTKRKFIEIIDLLLRHYHSNLVKDSAGFRCSATTLKKIDDHYLFYLHILEYKGYIYFYKVHPKGGEAYTLFRINMPHLFHLINVKNITIEKKQTKHLETYVDEAKEEQHKIHLEKLKQIEKATSKNFVKRYNEVLSLYQINVEKAKEHVKELFIENRYKKDYYYRIIDIISSGEKDWKELRTIDKNGRIYHIGTHTPKEIKKFTNIKFSIDCKNSHPVLLNYLILNYYLNKNQYININYLFNNFKYSSIYYEIINNEVHNKSITFPRNLRNQLNDNELDDTLFRIKNIPQDVKDYIRDTCYGNLWDRFSQEFEVERSVVKTEMFASIFYAYPSKRQKEDKWRDAFARIYPNVLQVVDAIKVNLHQQCKEEGAQEVYDTPLHRHINKDGKIYDLEVLSNDNVKLSDMITRLESKIFTAALTRLLEGGAQVFHIHDAIVSLSNDVSVDEVKTTLTEEYVKYGLIPTLSVDKY